MQVERAAEILSGALGGGEITGFRTSADGKRQYLIEKTPVGTIRLEVDRWSNLDRGRPLHIAWKWLRTRHERLGRFFEVISDPLDDAAFLRFAGALDVLGQNGARGANWLFGLSTNINVEITPLTLDALYTLLASYHRNAAAIHEESNLTFQVARRATGISRRLRRVLERPAPADLQTLFDEYIAGAGVGHSRLNVFNALLELHPELTGVPAELATRPPRPAAEFREAATLAATPEAPQATSEWLRHEVRFAQAMVAAARDGVPIEPAPPPPHLRGPLGWLRKLASGSRWY